MTMTKKVRAALAMSFGTWYARFEDRLRFCYGTAPESIPLCSDTIRRAYNNRVAVRPETFADNVAKAFRLVPVPHDSVDYIE